MYILLPVIFLLLFFPITVTIKVNSKLKDKKVELEPILNMKNYIVIKLFKIIPVYKYKLFSEKKKPKKRKKRKGGGLKIAKIVIKTLKIDKLCVSFGINTYSYILNSYLNALINTTICMYVNIHQNKFNFEQLYYQIYTSENPFVVNLEADVSASVAKVIYVVIKEKIDARKKDNKISDSQSKKMNKSKISCTY